MLYAVSSPKTGKIAKVGIGKAEDIMPTTNENRRAHNNARAVQKKDENFSGANSRIISTHTNITKGQMKNIEARLVRKLPKKGLSLPHNRERDKKYQVGYQGKKP